MQIASSRVALAALGLAAALSALVVGTTAGVLVAGAVAVIVWALTLDGWQRLYALMLVFLIGAESSVSSFASDSHYLRYIAAALLAAWTWRSPTGQTSRTGQITVRVLTAFTVLGFVSTAWSVDRATTIQQAVALLFLTGLVAGLVRTRWTDTGRIADDMGVAFTMLVGSAIVSIGLVAIGYSGARAFNLRAQGLYDNPNALGYLTAIAIPLGVACYLSTRRRWFLAGIFPLVVALVECQSRTALISVVGGLLWLVARRGSAAVTKTVITAVVAGVLLIASAPVFDFGTPAFVTATEARFHDGGGTGVLNSRGIAWGDAVDLWERQPVEGYGFQAGQALFENEFNAGQIDFKADVVHNSYLQVLLELGLLGSLVLLVAMLWVFAPVLFRSRSPFVGVVVTGLAVQITESAMFGTGQPYPWIFWLAVAAAALAVSERTGDDPLTHEPVRELQHA